MASDYAADNIRVNCLCAGTVDNGLTRCSGSLGADLRNDVVAMVKEFGREKRIHFAHLRNIKVDQRGNFRRRHNIPRMGRSTWPPLFALRWRSASTATRVRTTAE